MKKSKNELMTDKVNSDSFHVGIELELIAPSEGSEHDHERCEEHQREYLNSLTNLEIITDMIGLTRSAAESIQHYFDSEKWVDDYMSNWSCDGYCGFNTGNHDEVRENIENELRELTGNKSIKVVSDSSINIDESCETDAEVCWNYFASKETIKDNEKILTYLKKINCGFDKSCGLHINLNNYLNVPECVIPTSEFNFLFDFVASSRRGNSFCSQNGMSHQKKYSMIYHQGDRLEFRFFSPTLEADKLNHYVTLANIVYRRLAGKRAILPKRTQEFFLDKMQKVNGLTFDQAIYSINKVNTMASARSYIDAARESVENETEGEAA